MRSLIEISNTTKSDTNETQSNENMNSKVAGQKDFKFFKNSVL